jgi:hypothetical protein
VLGNHGVVGMTVEGHRAGDEVRVQSVRPLGDEDLEASNKSSWHSSNTGYSEETREYDYDDLNCTT